MKKIAFAAIALLSIIGCNEGEKHTPETALETTPVVTPPVADGVSAAVASNPDYIKGLALVEKSDCLGCHRVVETSVGPSYAAIAARYDSTGANIALLAKKIMEGGQGNWGEIAMAPHAGLAKEDAEQMVKYILQLKDAK